MGLLTRAVTWWNTATLGTAWFTWRKGEKIGEDDQGNIYYRHKNRDQDRRWVIYNGDIDASRVPPEWHAYLHYTIDEPPSERPPVVKTWEKAHVANLTGQSGAYFPPGSLAKSGERAKSTGDYEAWTPDAP